MSDSVADLPSRPGVVIDIGANAGEFTLELARRNPGLPVVAVEPVPSLATQIREAAVAEGLGHVHVLETALGDEAGTSTLNVSELGDWGVSSLLEFDPSTLATDEYWATREDLHFTSSREVTVRTLADVIAELGVDVVHFIKIDVQGLDVEVLASAGDQLSKVRAGMLEVPSVSRTRLYTQESSTLQSALTFLGDHGFDTYAVKPNDPATNEVNVYFVRAGEDPRQVEEDLSLRGVHLYDGKHFWARPAATIEAVHAAERRATDQDGRAAVLEQRIGELEERIATLEPLVDGPDDQLTADSQRARLWQRLQVLESELAGYHQSLGLTAPPPAPASIAAAVAELESATHRDLVARWADEARELDQLRRAHEVLAEKERRAVLALRKARDAAQAAEDSRTAIRGQLLDAEREMHRMRETVGWRLTEPLRAGRRLLVRRPTRAGGGHA